MEGGGGDNRSKNIDGNYSFNTERILTVMKGDHYKLESLNQCWGSERFFSDSDPGFQTYSDSDSAPFGSESESE